MGELKLFVVGEASPDPDEWCARHTLVIAPNAEIAEKLAMDSPAIEIPMNRQMVLEYGNAGWSDE